MISYHRVSTIIEALMVLQTLKPLNEFYPDFEDWFINKVMPSFYKNNTAIFLAKIDNSIIGVSIAKQGGIGKLSCIKVDPEWRHQGIGQKLINMALKFIGHDKPLCTVPEELINDFSVILINRYGFVIDRVEKGLYRSNKIEYCFNSFGHNMQNQTLYGEI